MKKQTRLLSIFVFIILLTSNIFGCSNKTVESKSAKGIFYKIEKSDKYLYLGGSVHLGKDFITFPDSVENAYKESNVLGVEIDITDPKVIQAVNSENVYSGGDNLDNHISTEAKEHISELLKEVGSKYDSNITKYKPTAIQSLITSLQASKSGFDFNKGMDRNFLTRAKGDNKTIVSLETLDTQLKVLLYGDDEYQNESLMKLTSLAESKEAVQKLYDSVINGDISSVEKQDLGKNSEDEKVREFYNVFITERNAHMVKKIEEYINTDDKYFVVVGAGHVVGEDGIINQLEDKGYTITRLE